MITLRKAAIHAAACVLLAFMAASGGGAQAVAPLPKHHNVFARAARAYGSTARNMVTFHDKLLAVEQWAMLGAIVADGVTTTNALRACSSCVETNVVLGQHPSSLGMWSLLLSANSVFLPTQTVMKRWGDESGSPGMQFLVPAIVIGAHVAVAADNQKLAASGGN